MGTNGCGCNDADGAQRATALLAASVDGSPGWGAQMLGAPAGAGGSYAYGQTADLSRTAFRVGGGTRVADLLHALTYVKGAPILGAIGATTPDMRVEVARISGGIPTIAPFDLTSAAVSDAAKPLASPQTFPIARLGGRVKLLALDERATAAGTGQSYASNNQQVAAVAVLAALDTMLARGTGAASPVDLKGLSQLSLENVRQATTATDIELDASSALTNVSCTDGAAGAGADCLIAGRRVIRKMMASTAGKSGMSGWLRDARTGRRVYHYLGVPVYRADVDEADVTLKGRLWAANLGPTGLNLVHVYGTRESLGLEVQETPVTSATGAREVTVMGAWTLLLWEPQGLFEVQKIDLTGF